MTPIPSVQSLRKSGYKVRVLHERYVKNVKALYPRKYFIKDNINDLSPKGGQTTVEITTPEGKDLQGIALCSKKDAFNRKRGLNIALARALA